MRGVYVALCLLSAPALAGKPLTRDRVPEPLKPWTDWVLHGQEASTCPFLQGKAEKHECFWPAKLSLTLEEKQGRFAQSFRVLAEGFVQLPGDERRWPQEVRVDGAAAVVTERGGAPHVYLAKGDHAVSGAFAWDSLPESLQISPATGLLSLTLRGAVVEVPNRDEQGKVWLQKVSEQQEGEKLELLVHRKVTDDLPLLLTTRITLNVSGKNREVLLGKALPEGFVPMELTSPLPARVERDSRLRVQVRPGTWTVELVARGEGPKNALTRPEPDGPWREGEEIWVFEARADLRLTTVEGVSAIDPQQTSLPDEWKRLPAYPMGLKDTLKLVEQRRGDSDPAPDQLTLSRHLWLDFDGKGYTASDVLTGRLNRAWRLEMAAPTQLGRVSVSGRDVFITRLTPESPAGVEVRQGQVQVSADSRVEGDVTHVPAVGWAHDFHQVSATLHLPAGWRLLHAAGVDDVPQTWLKHWTLLELFLVLITSLAVGRLFGWGWGALALVTLTLTFPEDDAPKWSWLAVLAAEALVRVIPEGKVRLAAKGARGVALGVLVLLTVPFLVQHVREGMYPVLARPDVQVSEGYRSWADSDTDESGMLGASSNLLQRSAKGGRGGAKDAYGFKQNRSEPAQQQGNFATYDPNSMVQTGPGQPSWDWTQLALRWSGPVEQDQRLHLYLLSPGVNVVLAFLRVALIAVLALCLLRFPGDFWPRGLKASKGAAALLAVLLAAGALAPGQAQAQAQAQVHDEADAVPVTPALLGELKDRLLQQPECAPACASSSRLSLEATGSTLRVRVGIDAAAHTAAPLPGGAAHWVPEEVLLDGQSAKGLLRGEGGVLWIELTPGSHQILLSGRLPNREVVQLPLPLKPHRVEARTEGWTLEGLHEDGLADDNLQLTRTRRGSDEGGAALQPGALPPFVRVERVLQLGLTWEVETKVSRVSPPGAAVVLEVPLLAGESVTTADVRVVGGKALVNMGPSQTEASWRSVLQTQPRLTLVAPEGLPWTELWRLDASPVWHVALTGIPVVHQQGAQEARTPLWRPWPGERVTIDITRPAGIPGQTLTVDHTVLEVTPGLRATDVTLTLVLRSSRGGQHVLTLPPNAVLQSVTVDGTVQPIRQEKDKVTLPTSPGAQVVVLTWRQTQGLGPRFVTPAVDVGAPNVNAEVTLHVPADRWVLFAGGPRTGPAVLFWSLFIVLTMVAVGLGRVRLTPLRSWEWLLLGIGLSTLHVVGAAVVAGWLLFLGWRQTYEPGLKWSAALYDVRQLLIIGWTFVAVALLAAAIYQGLLGSPDMQVMGNGSSNRLLRWFQDRSGSTLPSGWMLSVPLLVYRAVMLAWALWLALSLLRWVKWAWTAFSTGGAWKLPPPPPPRPPRATPVPAAGPAPAPGGGVGGTPT